MHRQTWFFSFRETGIDLCAIYWERKFITTNSRLLVDSIQLIQHPVSATASRWPIGLAQAKYVHAKWDRSAINGHHPTKCFIRETTCTIPENLTTNLSVAHANAPTNKSNITPASVIEHQQPSGISVMLPIHTVESTARQSHIHQQSMTHIWMFHNAS